MNKKAAAAVFLAGCCWGTTSIFVRKFAAAGLDSLQISALKTLASVLMFGLYILIRNPSHFKIALKDLWMPAGAGILGQTIFNWTYFYAIIYGEASVAVVLLYTAPVFTIIISAILFKEKITLRKSAAVVVTVLGCVLVAGLLRSHPNVSFPVLMAGVASGFLYCLFSIFNKFGMEKYTADTMTFYTLLLTLAGSALITDMKGAFAVASSESWVAGLAVFTGFLNTLLPCLLFNWGVKRMEAGQASLLSASEPAVGAILGVLILHESCDFMKVAGIILILAAIVILSTEEEKKKPQP